MKRLEFIILLILHLVLLYWIYFLLSHGGTFSLKKMFIHFLGISIFGAGLIYLSAFLAKRRYLFEKQKP